MPPPLASLLTAIFVFYLFRRDIREKPNITSALWIPTLWFFIIATRSVSEWLNLYGVSVGGNSLEEGSTVDALFYFGLIAVGLRVLMRRRVSLALFVRNNRWLVFFLVYCFVSIAWSDFPFVALKRWIKGLGGPIMVLIVFTEPSFEESLTRLLKRCAYVILPVSILFIKYYPEWGRGFSPWTGQAYNNGITLGKNGLGYDLLILGFFFVWHLLMTLHRERSKARRDELILCAGFLAMVWWLFSIADSKTPLVAFFLALAILFLTGFQRVNKRYIGGYILAAAAILITAEMTVGIYEAALELLGRNATLTERTPLWEELRKWGALHPILGTGFESFWLGKRREKIWEIMNWPASEAHNGYLETYLNLGALGLLLLFCLIAATYWKAQQALLRDPGFGRFRFAFLFGILIYNWTESSFGSLHPVFFMFFVIYMDYPKLRIARSKPFAKPPHLDEPAPAFNLV